MCVYRCNMSVYDTDEGSIWWYNDGKNWQKILACKYTLYQHGLENVFSDLDDGAFLYRRLS